jgi:membrane protease YdiL (CAAX protease family)
MGLVLGLLQEGTGAVAAPVGTHVAVNWINLLHLARRAPETPPPPS